MNPASVFPPVSALIARAVDAAGLIRWETQDKKAPRRANAPRPAQSDGPGRTTPMVDDQTYIYRHCGGKIRVHKDDNRWQVDYPCDCPDLNFRTHSVALTFATHHACPPPWAPVPARRKRLTRTVR